MKTAKEFRFQAEKQLSGTVKEWWETFSLQLELEIEEKVKNSNAFSLRLYPSDHSWIDDSLYREHVTAELIKLRFHVNYYKGSYYQDGEDRYFEISW